MNAPNTFPYTTKLYYQDSWLTRTQAQIVSIEDDTIEFNQTVAFPEWGGQEADMGIITLANGTQIPFCDTQKGPGRLICIEDFPVIQVETPIFHTVAPEYTDVLKTLTVGDTITIEIHTERRAKLTTSHTASHLAYIGIRQLRPDVIAGLKGCHIAPESARFDFSTEKRFTPEEIVDIERIANEYVTHNYVVHTYQHPQEAEAWYWECNGEIIPCGGTHLANTGSIGRIQIQRKNIGQGKERIQITFPEAEIPTNMYHI